MMITSDNQPAFLPNLLSVLAAFGVQSLDRVKIDHDKANFSISLPNGEGFSLHFQVGFREGDIDFITVKVEEGTRYLCTNVFRLRNGTVDLGYDFDSFDKSPYGRYLCEGFYVMGIDQKFMDFVELFTPREKIELLTRYRIRIQYLTKKS